MRSNQVTKKRLSETHRRRIAEALQGKIRAKNLAGQKFGRWFVISHVPKRANSTEAFWKCRCECGQFGEVSGHRLQQRKSGGCLSCQKRKRPFESMYNTLKASAAKRALPCPLTYEEFVEFTNLDVCHYCEASIVWVRFGTDVKANNPYNLDRKDNSLGYEKSNLVACCKVCNRVKSDHFSYEEMVEIGKIINAFQQRSN